MAGRWNGGIYEGDDTDELVEGRPSSDLIFGEGGNDTLFGGGRRDTLRGDEGDDILDGGGGADILDVASFGNDMGDDRASGGAGDDTISGGGGADELDGGSGDDLVYWDREDDGGAARFLDTLSGGEGRRDTLYLEVETSSGIDFTLGQTAEIRAGGITAAGTSGFEKLRFSGGDSFDRVTGGAFGDGLGGSGGDDTLAGLAGRDTISGGDGADVLRGGMGSDVINVVLDREVDAVSGGAGFDRLFLFDLEEDAALVVEQEAPGVVVARLGGEVVVRATSIEGLDADGETGDDSLTGLSGDDELSGDGGADTLRGAAGDDVLVGGTAGDDVLSGQDRIFGGEGHDTVLLGDGGDGVEVTLAGDRTVTAFVDGVAEDRLSGIENLTGGDGSDRLTGDGGDNVINGALDYGVRSHDTLDGGGGVDTLVLNGHYGRLDITLGDPDFVTVEGGGYTVSYRNFENVVGTQGRDAITGDDKANRLDGWNGSDSLTGGGGADVFAFTEFEPSAGGADVVTDFSRREGDKVDLSDFFADRIEGPLTAKKFIGEAAFSGRAGEVRFEAGETSRLQIDYNGNGSADFEILFANGTDIGARDVII